MRLSICGRDLYRLAINIDPHARPTAARPLVGAMGRAICAVTNRDALGFFEHYGYRIASQPH
jgi:hypothetical protein